MNFYFQVGLDGSHFAGGLHKNQLTNFPCGVRFFHAGKVECITKTTRYRGFVDTKTSFAENNKTPNGVVK